MKTYKYNRRDFKPLPVDLNHLDISLDFRDGKVRGTNVLHMTARQELSALTLDAQELEIISVARVLPDGGTSACGYDYHKDRNRLIVQLGETVVEGTDLTIRTETVCIPSDNILEGIYCDTTPEGCPQQYISQCQQWGFQRILPIFDDCTAKCTMTTTLEADARYTHLISNGNICKETNPEGNPVQKKDDPTRQVIKYVNDVPMAPYLFLVAIGTWDVLSDEVVYPSGKHVRLEYLVPPGRVDGVRIPMEILKASVLWQNETQEYEYPFDVYRTICMEKSNFGGMENVGNTTIITSAALIDEWTGDSRLEYAFGVIIHEFEHNQCGSDVTMETPFDMWLNEAFTVDVERQFTMSQFDPVWVRLSEIDSMRSPVSGPLAVEDAGHHGNIVREGFNHPDDLVDGVTYVKAAEVIRMLRLILGAETFRRAKNTYFERFKGGNANTDDFFSCFEEISGRDLGRFRQGWLHTIGYPRVAAEHSYDPETKILKVTFRQSSSANKVFHVPVEMAVVDESGSDIPGASRAIELTEPEQEQVFENMAEPAFISYNRDCSFYGTFDDLTSSREQLIAQIQLDSNAFNRVEAMRRLTDIERIKLINDPAAEVDKEWLRVYADRVADDAISTGMKAYLLRIDEQSLDRKYLPCYRERYNARVSLIKAVADYAGDAVLNAFKSIDTYRKPREPRDGIEERRLKAFLLRVLAEINTKEILELMEAHFRAATHITDRVSALHCLTLTDHPGRLAFMEEAYEEWKNHLPAYSSYLAVAGSGIHDDVFDLIAREEKRATFKISHPGHMRALFLPMAGNNKMLWTREGLDWLVKSVIRLTPINEVTTSRLVGCLQQVSQLADDLKPMVIDALLRMDDGIDAEKYPSVSGRVRAYLERD